ncbi:hypothetical protein ACHAWO_003983 [Cyclotella atomus]|uniref:MI domain-containing protein n=1 Tax=Cyclotella atomus TaxID=382360 RepID=A0ABD3NZ38_9STRA
MKRKTAANNRGSSIVIEASNRKARRKELRNSKKIKKKQQNKHHDVPTPTATGDAKPKKKKLKTDNSSDISSSKRVQFSSTVDEKIIPIKSNPSITTSLLKKSRRDHTADETSSKKNSFNTSTTHYDNLDDETAAALRRDDMEIEYLESSLGIRKTGNKKGNRELNREYAKNEGFGDDFGDFLMGLDSLVERVVSGKERSGEEEEGSADGLEDDGISSDESEKEGDASDDASFDRSMSDDEAGQLIEMSPDEKRDASDDGLCDQSFYDNLDEETALAFRNDDAEIADLESKLGLSTDDKKSKKKLNKEFAKSFSGYGEDFGDFLDELDSLAYRVGMGKIADEKSVNESEEEASDAQSIDGSSDDSEDGSSQESDASEVKTKKAADHDVAFTYRPASGEDIYGNKIDSNSTDDSKPTKYIPPHLRKKMEQESAKDNVDDAAAKMKSVVQTADPDTLRLIQRSLNNSLNRLSENTLESVSKSLAALYAQYPFHDMNTCMWKNIQSACIPPAMVMSGLIPLYIAAVSGVHWIGGDQIQLGGCLIEWSTKQLHDLLEKGRSADDEERLEFVNKEAANSLLIVCYLYNYGVVHCSLIYDIVKDLIKSFCEIDVESLLLILSHCGQQLRSDDPSALREIILMVKEQAQHDVVSTYSAQNKVDSSRVEFMLSTITELKNNKPRKQDAAIREKTATFKKCIGRLKSSASNSLLVKGTGTCLKITLQDILNAETKGRWWIMGASWAGNQKFKSGDDELVEDVHLDVTHDSHPDGKSKKDSDEEKLLALASSQRMNTDTRRSIFCIVMTSSDCNDAFAKLSRAELLKPKNERDVIRVLVHCCGEEKSFNPFYAHLIMRVCEYQPKSKFTLMLSFWDIFKQLDAFNDRKTANLAKLLAKLLMGTKEKYLTIGALKRIDFSPTEISDQVVLFLSIVMTNIFETVGGAEMIRDIFDVNYGKKNQPQKSKRKRPRDVFDSEDEDNVVQPESKREDLNELRENIGTFLLQYVKSNPKNVEGSKWSENFTNAVNICESNK